MARIKLDSNDVEMIKYLIDNSSLFHREIADMFGVTRGHITKIKNKKRWNYEYGSTTRDANVREIERRVALYREGKIL